jgi:Na+/H+-dicarboxylate symporter
MSFVKYLSFLKPLPMQLLLCLFAALFFGQYLDHSLLQGLYTLSCIIKDILAFVLPLIIFTYIFNALLSLDKKAPLVLLIILVMVFISNLTAVSFSGVVASVVLPILSPFDPSNQLEQLSVLRPFFELALPSLISPEIAMFLGIFGGFGSSFLKIESAKKVASSMTKVVTYFLQKTFIPFLPVYVTGFVLKLQYEGAFVSLVQNYFQVLLLSAVLIISYISMLYFIGSSFSLSRSWVAIRNMLPAGIAGFFIMSSAAAMPLTLAASENNLKDPRFADLIIPTTVNIHMLGDCLAIPLTGLALLWFKTGSMPSVESYAIFAFMFAIAKFSCAGIPGGGVLVLLPVLQKYLGLDEVSIGLLTTLYILQDSVYTASNVMANGAFAMLLEKICSFFTRK